MLSRFRAMLLQVPLDSVLAFGVFEITIAFLFGSVLGGPSEIPVDWGPGDGLGVNLFGWLAEQKGCRFLGQRESGPRAISRTLL